jgi:hypothetical protein
MIAQRRFKKLKVIASLEHEGFVLFSTCEIVWKFNVFYFQYDYRHHIEALRLKKKEERELKEAGNKRAKEIAEQNYRVNLYLHLIVLFLFSDIYYIR